MHTLNFSSPREYLYIYIIYIPMYIYWRSLGWGQKYFEIRFDSASRGSWVVDGSTLSFIHSFNGIALVAKTTRATHLYEQQQQELQFYCLAWSIWKPPGEPIPTEEKKKTHPQPFNAFLCRIPCARIGQLYSCEKSVIYISINQRYDVHICLHKMCLLYTYKIYINQNYLKNLTLLVLLAIFFYSHIHR